MKDLTLNNIDLKSPIQKTILIIVIGVLLNSAFLYFGVFLIRCRITGMKNSIWETIYHNDRIKGIIDTTNTTKEQVAVLQKEHDELIAKGVLTPLLNSYAMRAKTLVTPLAEKASLKIENVNRLPQIPLQQTLPLKNEIFCRQPIQFITSGSYTQITAFISYVEEELPMAVLSSLQILSQQQSPENHKVAISFEWPVKTELTSQN